VTVLTAVLVNKDLLEMAQLVKISMSAPQIPVHVTRTRTAPTVTVLIAALANKGLMEMVQLAKMLTSVLQIPTRVTITPTVLIPRVPTAVGAN